jgi:NADPH-dependent 2,4-dienoyl-CoA reductase/sulfur reductase-like enzyme
MTTADIAVIGAGPAGMAAAIAARSAGLSVVVLDEQQAPGGQIYRGVLATDARRSAILGSDYSDGARLAQDFAQCGAEHRTGASVWQVSRERRIDYLRDGVPHELNARAVILCTGAMERPFPVPGWTLPGVMTAGAGQILLKASGLIPAGPVVLAGCGPLLYLLAVQYLRAGVRIAAVVDTTERADVLRALPLLPGALGDLRLLLKGWGLLRALKASGTRIFRGARGIAIEGTEAAHAISFRTRQGEQRIEASLFLLHQGIVPNTQVTRSLRATHLWDEGQLCFRPGLSTEGALAGVPGFFVAGDGASIMGAPASAASGALAGLAAARTLGASGLDARIAQAQRKLQSLRRARPFIDAVYQPRREFRIPADPVLVCRCEEITAGEIRRHVRAGCVGPNQLKSFTRCGMGPCQGRQCGLTASEIIAAERGVAPAEVGYQRVRPPIKPITVGELAGE